MERAAPPHCAAVRLATTADAAAVADLYLRSRAAAPGVPALVHSDDDVRSWITEVIVPAGDTWLAVGADGGRPEGLLVLDGDWIEQLYVAPEAWRRGRGRALVRHAQARRDALQLWTFVANADARAFYAAHGFTVDGPPSGDNEEGEPALRYRWHRAHARGAHQIGGEKPGSS